MQRTFTRLEMALCIVKLLKYVLVKHVVNNNSLDTQILCFTLEKHSIQFAALHSDETINVELEFNGK
jgi:hypothetical protein